MADPIRIECPLPPSLAGFDLSDAETRDFDGHADNFYRVDVNGRLWRRPCCTDAEERFFFNGSIDVDGEVGGDFAWFRLRFLAGELREIGDPIICAST